MSFSFSVSFVNQAATGKAAGGCKRVPRALAAKPGLGTIDRIRLSSTRTARVVATNIGSSIRLRQPRRPEPEFHATVPSYAAEPVEVVPSPPGAAGRTSGIRTGRVRATLAP